MSAARVAALAVGAALGVRSAGAQVPPAPPAAAAKDTTPKPTLGVNGQLLRAEHLRYEMWVAGPDSAHIIGQRDMDVRQTTYGAFPAWSVVETRTGAVPSTDSLYLSYVEFRPEHWSSWQGSSRLTVDFTPDSIAGTTNGLAGKRTFTHANRGDLLVGAPMTELALELMPLAVGWQDSLAVLLIDLGGSRITPAVVEVLGEEDIATALGTLHCWIVSLRVGSLETRFWVSQVNPVVVLTRQELPGRPGVVFEQRLVQRR